MSKIVHLEVGQMVSNRFKITKKIGEGAFGAVYQCTENEKEYALKTEHANEKQPLLKLELFVMKKLREAKTRHSPDLIAQGMEGDFNYIVMKLLGRSLQEVKKVGLNGHLTLGSAIGCAMQCLRALEELHWAGFLHRDVKPGNFAIGRAETGEVRRVFVLDFGMCRRYVDKENFILPPRKKALFRGTPRYAAIASHNFKEHGRKEDVESWFYMLVDFTNANLPWKPITDINGVGESKKNSRNSPLIEKFFDGCPVAEYTSILRLIDGLYFFDEPDYGKIYETLRAAMKSRGVKELPYDWED